jgi:TolA-binding protein
MKKILLGLLLSITLFACSNDESKMKSGIADYLSKTAKDPKSYEFIELKVIDTITVGKCATNLITSNNDLIADINIEIQKLENEIKDAQQDIDYKEFKKDFDKIINAANSSISILKLEINDYEKENIKLKKITTLTDVVFYNANHKFRLKNGFGALDLDQKYVLFDKEFNVKYMSSDILDFENEKDKLFKETDFYKKL